jgi:hypothetical protein
LLVATEKTECYRYRDKSSRGGCPTGSDRRLLDYTRDGPLHLGGAGEPPSWISIARAVDNSRQLPWQIAPERARRNYRPAVLIANLGQGIAGDRISTRRGMEEQHAEAVDVASFRRGQVFEDLRREEGRRASQPGSRRIRFVEPATRTKIAQDEPAGPIAHDIR